MQDNNKPASPKHIVALTGEPLTSENETEHSAERKSENSDFVPVIIKRTDETFRHPDDILEQAIHEGVEQHQRRNFSLFLSSIAAGMILCFTALVVGVMASILENPDEGFGRIIMASVYPLGFVLVILSRTQLFTEHTATAVYPVLDGKANFISLLRLWAIVGTGNLVGS
jgi:formate/nitrite transporter FocA (FNT family)